MAASTSGIYSYRDRTGEFRSVSDRLKKVGGVSISTSHGGASSGPGRGPGTAAVLNDAPSSSVISRSEFNKRAAKIGLGIHEASRKIARLAQLAKRSSMFDDPTLEIQELTALIRNDITMLNSALLDVQSLQNIELADGNMSRDSVVHATTICDDLKNRLMGTTKQFKDVLTARTENLKAHENRKQLFSTSALSENSFVRNAKSTEPPPWTNMPNAYEASSSSSGMPLNGVSSSNQLRRRLAVESAPSPQMELSMLQQVVPRQENYTQSRAVALQNVESTISELGGIFTQLATMVAQQGELAIRIDDNMEESLANVESARTALLKHLNRISSNRWLLVKIFAMLILFLLIFIIFVL